LRHRALRKRETRVERQGTQARWAETGQCMCRGSTSSQRVVGVGIGKGKQSNSNRGRQRQCKQGQCKQQQGKQGQGKQGQNKER
jgi:hypothetical protein